MSTVEMPTIRDKYAGSVVAKFESWFVQCLSVSDRVETTTPGWDAESIRRNLIKVGLAAYEATDDVSQVERPDLGNVDSYIEFILKEGHTKLSRGDRLDMFLSTAMDRPWVTRKKDGTPRVTCDMCKIFSEKVDTTRVKRESFSGHWLDCPEDRTCIFTHPDVNGRYSTGHQTHIARFHTNGSWRSYPEEKFHILESTLKQEEDAEEESIALGLPRYFFHEPWCARPTHACHLELKGEVTKRGSDLRYFNALKSGGLPEQMWRVTDDDVRKGIKQVKTGKIEKLWESKPDAWESVPDYLQVAVMAVLKIEEQLTRHRALEYSAYCRSVRTDGEVLGEETLPAPLDDALVKALKERAHTPQTSASAGVSEEGVA